MSFFVLECENLIRLRKIKTKYQMTAVNSENQFITLTTHSLKKIQFALKDILLIKKDQIFCFCYFSIKIENI